MRIKLNNVSEGALRGERMGKVPTVLGESEEGLLLFSGASFFPGKNPSSKSDRL